MSSQRATWSLVPICVVVLRAVVSASLSSNAKVEKTDQQCIVCVQVATIEEDADLVVPLVSIMDVSLSPMQKSWESCCAHCDTLDPCVDRTSRPVSNSLFASTRKPVERCENSGLFCLDVPTDLLAHNLYERASREEHRCLPLFSHDTDTLEENVVCVLHVCMCVCVHVCMCVVSLRTCVAASKCASAQLYV